jgi:hypothetical protein
MRDSERYRFKAAECLLAAERCEPSYRKQLHLSMALSWLSLARADEPFANWNPNLDTGPSAHP